MARRRRDSAKVASAQEAVPQGPATAAAAAPTRPAPALATLHRVRFIEWTPSSVVALAPAGDDGVLAVGRETGESSESERVADGPAARPSAALAAARPARPP